MIDLLKRKADIEAKKLQPADQKEDPEDQQEGE